MHLERRGPLRDHVADLGAVGGLEEPAVRAAEVDVGDDVHRHVVLARVCRVRLVVDGERGRLGDGDGTFRTGEQDAIRRHVGGSGTGGAGTRPDTPADGSEQRDDSDGRADANQDAVASLRLLALLPLQTRDLACLFPALILGKTFLGHDRKPYRVSAMD